MDPTREGVREALLAIGFDEVRFASLSQPTSKGLRQWLSKGYQAEMSWMERSEAKRSDPQLVLPGARSAILLGINYGPRRETLAKAPRWARYSLYEDYHDTVKEGLVRAGRELEALLGIGPSDYRYYVDTGPVLEREWAARAGLGFIGKNAMLISRRHGNWLFLSAILVRADFEPDPPVRPSLPETTGIGLLCGKCTRCMDACPTQAFAGPGIVNSSRCVSYQTIENKGPIPRELRSGIGDRIYGCDTCLEVCPWNRFAAEGRRSLLAARSHLADLSLDELLALSQERFAALFKGMPMKRVKWTGLLRNACVVAGNSADPIHVPALRRLASHASPLVRAHAVWAIRRLQGGAPMECPVDERDPQVIEEYLAPI